MAAVQQVTAARSTPITGERPVSSVRFDLLYTALSFWFIAGAYLDGWAHFHGMVDNTFLTPWHAVLYSGFGAVAVLTLIALVRGKMQGYAWSDALPVAYTPALIGVGIFAVGGAFDFAWHNLFGFEAGIEALYSPSHLLLATGAFLYLTAPIRAAWQRRESVGWRDLLPAVLGMTWTFSLITFFMQYTHWAGNPDEFINTWSVPDHISSSFLLYTLVIPASMLIGIVMIALRRWTLPVGAVTLMVTINVIMMTLMRWRLMQGFLPILIAPILGGVLADVLIWRFKPSAKNPTAMRWLAFSVPFVISLVYILLVQVVMQNEGGLWWRIHMWLGAPVITGIIGLFLSFLAAPPALPE